MQREIRFRSQGVTIRGYLLLPAGSTTGGRGPPVLILSHGFSATQHIGLLDTARAISGRTGCAALTFDHAGFGESDGERHYFCHWTQATGYLDAVTYLRQVEAENVDVERICLWGESLSSRLALVASSVEPLIKGLILVTPPCGRRIGEWMCTTGTCALASKAREASFSSSSGNLSAVPIRPSVSRELQHPCESEGALDRSYADLPTSPSPQQADAAEHEKTFSQIRMRLISMRAKTVRLDDETHGPSGGATIPGVETTSTIKVGFRGNSHLRSRPQAVNHFRSLAVCFQVIPVEALGPHLKKQPVTALASVRLSEQATGGSTRSAAPLTSDHTRSGAAVRPTTADSIARPLRNYLRSPPHTLGGRSGSRKRRESTWLREESRCKNPQTLIDFINVYSQLPRTYWANEIIRVERPVSCGQFSEQVAVPHIHTSLCFIVAEADEMENCKKEVQRDTFLRAINAKEPRMYVEVPCASGGHVGMMDSMGLVGHHRTWSRMVDATVTYLERAFGLQPPERS